MMKAEFEALIGKSVTEGEYKDIEMVYTWHPAIKNTTGKDQMALLYNNFGMGVIKGMVPVAKKMEGLDGEMTKLEAQMHGIHQREEMLAEGDTRLEYAIDKLNVLYMKSNSIEEYREKLRGLNLDPDIVRIAIKFVER